MACSLVAVPFPIPASVPIEVVGLIRWPETVILCFEDRASGEPVDVIISRRADESPAYLKTEFLNLGYGATEASGRAEALVQRAANRLRGLRFEQLASALDDKGIAVDTRPGGVGPRWARGPSDTDSPDSDWDGEYDDDGEEELEWVEDPVDSPEPSSPAASEAPPGGTRGEGQDIGPSSEPACDRSAPAGEGVAGGRHPGGEAGGVAATRADGAVLAASDDRCAAPSPVEQGESSRGPMAVGSGESAGQAGEPEGGRPRRSVEGGTQGTARQGHASGRARKRRRRRRGASDDAAAARARRQPLDRSDPQFDPHDGLHEVWNHPHRWFMFFADTELRRGRDVIMQCALPWVHVEHGDMECRFVGIGDFVSYPWRSPWERGSHNPHLSRADEHGEGPPHEGQHAAQAEPREVGPQSRGFFTDMGDMDVIDGGRDKLLELFGHLRELEDIELVSVNCTCVPQIIGDDVGPIVQAERQRCMFPILYRDQTSSVYGHHIDTLVELLEQSDAPEVDPRAVNLVGFREGPGLDELRGSLVRAGLRVNVCLIPELSPALVRRYRRAPLQVLCPNQDWEGIYQHVVGRLGLKTLRPEPPYGVRRSIAWLEAVAAAGGGDSWERERSRIDSLLRDRWEPLVSRAEQVGIGLVIDRGRMPMLLDAARMYSLPLLGVLLETGVRIHFAVHGEVADTERVRSQLAAAEVPDGRIVLERFTTPAELRAWLEQPGLQLVYTDYGYDHRVTSAGKTPVSAQIFELGVEGAIRTLDRLVRLAELPLYARFGRYLGRAEVPW